jgi:electron transport complex protein RnfG
VKAHRTLSSGLLLGIVTAAGIALVTAVQECTQARIAAHARAVPQQRLQAVLAASKYNNDILKTEHRIETDALSRVAPALVYLARRDGEPVAAIFDMVAPDGYNGPIRLLIGVYYNGIVSGVRVISHRETPGLGDAIEADESDWIFRFTGRSLDDPPTDEWEAERDGGAFDQITGATITSRAVVGAVRRALLYLADRKQALFAMPSIDPSAQDD